MKKRVPFILGLLVISDFVFYQAVKTLTSNPIIISGYWLYDLVLMAGLILIMFVRRAGEIRQKLISWLMALVLISLVPKIFSLPVLLIEDIAALFPGMSAGHVWISELALGLAAIPFFGLLYGLTLGRHYYKVRKETIYFKDLPVAFDGFTITQISDVHSGSFTSSKGVEKGVAIVNEQNSDMILFTGDLVNNHASEMDPWINTFEKLKAPVGKFSVLGNHDYGDYMKWQSDAHQRANLNRLKEIHSEMGFKLLLNESVEIYKDDEAIALIGVENWGKGGFHKYGDLNKATSKVRTTDFKILMSHDPSHWDAIAVGHDKHIHLTLSGHTHGAQFGIELFGFKWSPIKYVYKQWAGLYQQEAKYLYVNRGFGFLGLKGRVGIWPEITVITLRKTA